MGQIFSNKISNNSSGYLFESSFSLSSFDTRVRSLPSPSYTKFWVENETSFCRIHYECETKKPAGVRGGEKYFLIVHLNLLVIDNKLTRQYAYASPYFLKKLRIMEIIWIALFYVLFIQALIIITFPIPYFFIGLALALCVVGGLVFLHQFQLLL